MIVYGVNAVIEALRSGQVRAVRVATDGGRLVEVRRLATAHGVPVARVAVEVLDRVAGGAVHQGVDGAGDGVFEYDTYGVEHVGDETPGVVGVVAVVFVCGYGACAHGKDGGEAENENSGSRFHGSFLLRCACVESLRP